MEIWVKSQKQIKRLKPAWFLGLCSCAAEAGAPNDCFLQISVRKSKYCLEFSITWGRIKISRDHVPFMSNFGTLSNKFPYDFLKFDFSHFTPQDRHFFSWKKETLKLSESKVIKNVIERGIRKILTFITSYWFHLKFSGNIISTEARPLVISNGLKLPGMTELIQNL